MPHTDIEGMSATEAAKLLVAAVRENPGAEPLTPAAAVNAMGHGGVILGGEQPAEDLLGAAEVLGFGDEDTADFLEGAGAWLGEAI